jgi:hypothetical protein
MAAGGRWAVSVVARSRNTPLSAKPRRGSTRLAAVEGPINHEEGSMFLKRPLEALYDNSRADLRHTLTRCINGAESEPIRVIMSRWS